MIVLDTSALVSAAMDRGSVPDRAVPHALASDRVAVSEATMSKLLDTFAIFFTPTVSVTDCRDAKDSKYLELALAAGATTIVTGDADLLVLHPWRGVRIRPPAAYLAEVEGQG